MRQRGSKNLFLVGGGSVLIGATLSSFGLYRGTMRFLSSSMPGYKHIIWAFDRGLKIISMPFQHHPLVFIKDQNASFYVKRGQLFGPIKCKLNSLFVSPPPSSFAKFQYGNSSA